MIEYRTDFYLDNDVLDINSANEYLKDNEMLWFFDGEFKDDLEKIEWNLINTHKGYVSVVAKRKLTDSELKELSKYISGQNSDGLCEGFEQQEFACYDAGLYDDFGRYQPDLQWEDDYEEEYIMCSFDWQTNDYELKEYK